ncbi:MAG: 30S ribosomal protein S18 [Caldilineaceae bacterium]|nr:30S ribosomal protein S18 [Caldilineaceae bacterium]
MNESEELEEVTVDTDEDFDTDYDDDDDADVPAADDDDYDDSDDDDGDDVTYSEGPAVFSRAREGQAPTGRRRNLRSLAREVKMEDIDYKRVQILSRFVDRHGRILSRRKTRISAKMQRKITREIKRARHLALMPYTGEHVRITRKRA